MNTKRAETALRPPVLPSAPASIQKGVPLKNMLNQETVECLAQNIRFAYKDFQADEFCEQARSGLETLELMQRAKHIAKALREFLPGSYSEAVATLIASFTAEQTDTEVSHLSGFFYLPHSFFMSEYGWDTQYNNGADPFEPSMEALHALTTRFTSEFAIRPFLIHHQQRTLSRIAEWLDDPNPHVRRLCSEGTRPRLPWGIRIPAFVADPQPTLHVLEALKDDASLYVRRSVANHLGDIAKDHPDTAFSICERWLRAGASKELRWVIRHALRHPAKKGNARALEIRGVAKAGG